MFKQEARSQRGHRQRRIERAVTFVGAACAGSQPPSRAACARGKESVADQPPMRWLPTPRARGMRSREGERMDRPPCAGSQPPAVRRALAREEHLRTSHPALAPNPRPYGVRWREESIFEPVILRWLPTPAVRRALAARGEESVLEGPPR